MEPNLTKHKLSSQQVAVGTMVFEFTNPGMPAVCAAAGADFALFDQEATGCNLETIHTLVAAARGTGISPIVRVPANQPHMLSRVLDVGAAGVMVPTVESAAQAEAIVQATKYPPVGERGAISGLAAHAYRPPSDVAAAFATANDETLLIAQVESVSGVEHVDEIAAVDGIDVLWIGHLDLTVSLGNPGRFDDPRFTEAVARVLAAAEAHDIVAAIKVGSVEEGQLGIEQGFRCICYGDDVRLFRNSLAEGVAALRGE